MIAVRVIVAFVVLPQEIDAVVAAIWRSDQSVDVMGRWDPVIENDARMIQADDVDAVWHAIIFGRRLPGLLDIDRQGYMHRFCEILTFQDYLPNCNRNLHSKR